MSRVLEIVEIILSGLISMMGVLEREWGRKSIIIEEMVKIF